MIYGLDLERLYCACGHTGVCHLAERVRSGVPARTVAMLYYITSRAGRRRWLTRYGRQRRRAPTQHRFWLAVAAGVLYAATAAADVFAFRATHEV